ncbi:DUF1302 family protein [Candidatus Poribacteria bacterium]
MKRVWIFALGLLLLSQQVSYAQLDVKGFVDTYHAARVKEPHDYLTSRTRVRLEAYADGEDASMFASFNAVKNHILPSRTGIELREAYLQYAAESWDLRAGRQIIIWGKADGVQITDVISPLDYTEFLAQDYDDIRMPVDALKFRYLRDQMTVELVWTPVFQSSILPVGDNPWAIGMDVPDDMEIYHEDPVVPERKLGNSEIGGKVSFYLPGIDLALSSLYTWDKFPVMNQTLTEALDTKYLTIQPEHNRLTFVGIEFSTTYRSFVFRGESALYTGQYFEPQDLSDGLFRKKTINWLLGVDWYPGGGWTLSAQFADFFILDYDEKIGNDRHEMQPTFSISKSLLRETLTLSTFGYVGINDSELFNRSSVDYELTDGLHLEAGIDFFAGDEGSFGQYKDNTEVWSKAKYSF